VNREDEDRATAKPEALSGALGGIALVWVILVVGVYLAVREFGLVLVH
jgi:hypothetical protein